MNPATHIVREEVGILILRWVALAGVERAAHDRAATRRSRVRQQWRPPGGRVLGVKRLAGRLRLVPALSDGALIARPAEIRASLRDLERFPGVPPDIGHIRYAIVGSDRGPER